MKKILLCVPLLAIFAAGFFGCSQQRQWNHEQRKAMREALRSYRQMVYLDDLNDAEFVLFSDEVAGQLENSYPVYMEFVQMQGVDDTVDMVVVSTIVDELNADARNMRHIYPYNYLVAQGVLPAGLDHEQQKAFYSCSTAKPPKGWKYIRAARRRTNFRTLLKSSTRKPRASLTLSFLPARISGF